MQNTMIAALLLLMTATTSTAYAADLLGFSLYDASGDRRIAGLRPSGVYEVAGRSLAITADTSPGSATVEISIAQLDGAFSSSRTERAAPYFSFGDRDGNFTSRSLPEGRYRVTASLDGQSMSVDFYLTSSTADTTVDERFSESSMDLLSLHYDFAPDPDDVLSAVYDRAIIETEGISLSRVVMVTGTVGTNASRYEPAQAEAMDQIWPNVTKLDAMSNHSSAVASAADRWLQVIRNGGDIWVKEGGQSDFTADVVRRLLATDSSVDTRARIHVIQHSAWNENVTTSSDLSYVKNYTNYVKIDDGNELNNTADLQTGVNATLWWQEAEASNYGSIVSVAHEFLNRVDGSDTVELLHALNIGMDVVRYNNDMLYRYLAGGPGSGSDQPPIDNDDGGSCVDCISSATFVDPRHRPGHHRLNQRRFVPAGRQGAGYPGRCDRRLERQI